MFDDVAIRASDLEASTQFYGAVVPTLGTSGVSVDGGHGIRFADLSVLAATADHPVTTRLHVGLVAPSEDAVQRFWQAGIDAGFSSDGAPGPRPEYAPDYFGGFLLDPDGNSIEAVRHGNLRTDGGLVDHVWVRVLHAGMAARFLGATKSGAGFERVAGDDTSARFRGPQGGSLTVIEGAEPTTGLSLAIGDARYVDPDGRS